MAKFDPNPYMMKLKGKDYLPVAPRIAWFREEYPHGVISTDVVELTDQRCVMKATIRKGDVATDPQGIATGYGSETPGDFKDYIEKAETKAIGRALAALGYGTLQAPELDEGNRIVDTPQGNPTKPQEPRSASQSANPDPDTNAPANLDRERVMKRLHAIGNTHGIDHDGLRTIASAVSVKHNEGPLDSLANANAKLLAFVADAIERDPKGSRERLDELVRTQAELTPGIEQVPNPARHTN